MLISNTLKIKKIKKSGGPVNMKKKIFNLPKNWYTVEKKKISCKEKIKLLNQNIEEFQNLAHDILDEAILMGVDKKQILKIMANVISSNDSSLKSVE